MKPEWHSLIHRFRQFLAIVILVALALVRMITSEPTLKATLGLLFFFLPGYSITRFVSRDRKNDLISTVTFTVIISLSVLPLIGYLVQLTTFLSFYTLLPTVLVLSLLLMIPEIIMTSKKKVQQKIDNNRNQVFLKLIAFFGALAIGLGLYVQASLGVVAPRGEDIYRHMSVVNGLLSTGKTVFQPDLNTVSNYYYLLYAELSLLTGLDVLSTALLAQTMLGAVYVMSMFYFAHCITESSASSFISAVLFIAGPPLYVASATPYFWYFHPMWVGMSIFPFTLAHVHKTLSDKDNKSIGLSSMLIAANFLYHLAVGLTLAAIILLDFIFLLIKSRRRLLALKFFKMLVLVFSFSSVLTIPFLLNVTNPFEYVYPQGGLQTLYAMFFGESTYGFTSPFRGWTFFAKMLSDFMSTVLPLLVIGVPGLIHLFIKRSKSFTLILSCILVGLIGIFQPWLGVSFLPQRFNSPLIMFGSTLIGASLSLIMVVPYIQIRKHGSSIRIRVGISKGNLGRLTLLLLMLSYIFLFTYLEFYSPAREAVLAAELGIREGDLDAIRWMDENTPRDSKILMDQYFQTYFTGTTGRKQLFSITAEKSLYEIWDIYPVNVYIGQSDPLKVDADYIVISRWCYTTWSFVGTQYFDQHPNLTRIYERGQYVVYQVTR